MEAPPLFSSSSSSSSSSGASRSSSRVPSPSFTVSPFVFKGDPPAFGAVAEPTSVLDSRIPSPASTRSSSCDGPPGVFPDVPAQLPLSGRKSIVADCFNDHLVSAALFPPPCLEEEDVDIWLQNGNDGLLEDIAGISTSYNKRTQDLHAVTFSAAHLSQSDSFLSSPYITDQFEGLDPASHGSEFPPLKRRNISGCALPTVLPGSCMPAYFAGYGGNIGVEPEGILDSPASLFSFHSLLPSICSPHQELYCKHPTGEDQPPAVEMQRFWMPQLQPPPPPPQQQQEVIIEKLVVAVEAAQVGDYALAQAILVRLNHLSPALLPGNPPLLRAAFYLKEALMTDHHLGPAPLADSSPLELFRMINAFKELCQCSPIPTFGYLACNEAILEAVEGKQSIHIIDFFPGGVGLQWVSFLQDVVALRERTSAPLHLRITMVGSLHRSLEMQLSGEELSQLGTRLDLSLEIKMVTILPYSDSDSDLHLLLDIREGEAVAINFGNGVDEVYSEFATVELLANLVRFMRAVSPKVVSVAAAEEGVNIFVDGTKYGDHLKERLRWYTSVLESLGGRCSNAAVEKVLLEPRIRALVGGARGGFLAHWRRLLQGAGFRERPMSTTAHYQADIVARGFKAGFSVVASQKDGSGGGGALLLRWWGQPLATAFSWVC